MSAFPLSGTVSKAVLLVRPAYAQEKELLHFLKFKLYDAGFIVVREEYRRLNTELAQELCQQFDQVPAYFAPADSASTGGGPGSGIPDSMLPSVEDMVGNAYVYVLAHGNCHAELQKFLVEKLLFAEEAQDDEAEERDANGEAVTYGGLLSAIASSKSLMQHHHGDDDDGSHAANTSAPPPAVFLNRTADGARKSVALLFPRMLSADVPTAVQSREYVQANLKASLLPALTELSKRKPADPLRWLADQLLTNNPHSPPMVNEGV